MTITPPPRPPAVTDIKYRDEQLVVGILWQKWTADLATVGVQAIDNAGARKRVVTLVFSTPAGDTKRYVVPASGQDKALAWVAQFQAWQHAVHPR